MVGPLALSALLIANPFEACVVDAQSSFEVDLAGARVMCTLVDENRRLRDLKTPPPAPPPRVVKETDWSVILGTGGVALVVGLVGGLLMAKTL